MVELEREFNHALNGREVWLKIKEKYHITNRDGIVMFPSENMVLNREAVALLPVYKKKVYLNKIIAVTDRQNVADFVSNLNDGNIVCEEISQEAMEAVLKYYRLVSFCSHISVVSLAEPYGGEFYLSESGVGLSDFILCAIYKVR